jgi:4-alpha-glucanotransferase
MKAGEKALSDTKESSRRGSGILLHLTSLPSCYGVGDLGPEAYRFADFLARTRQTYWQLLPLNATSSQFGNSPYSSSSAFAGNPLLISPDLLVEEGLLSRDDLRELPSFPQKRVNYPLTAKHKRRLLERAYERFRDGATTDPLFESFCRDNADWLDDYALFAALRERFRDKSWVAWPTELKERNASALAQWGSRRREEITKQRFLQYIFFQQWTALKSYCNRKKILLIGDLPIYVDYDSADVWANSRIFKLDAEKRPTVVAGVPPDYFSATGQLWGNPVYDWEALRTSAYRWWLDRLRLNCLRFDRLRLDHFRGFVAAWEVPAGAADATNGRWVEAPGSDFFDTVVREFPTSRFIAEDLGLITPDVRELMTRFGFTATKVLLFAFGPDLPQNPYAPHNYERNSVVYTGTHDTNTVRGWFEKEASREERWRFFDYLGRKVRASQVHWEMIKLAWLSVAKTAITPMQDLLGLGAAARMNRPSTPLGNWEWRLAPERVTTSLADELTRLTELSGRA